MSQSSKLLVAQGGGPTAVINQSLAGVVLEARKFAGIDKVYGALHGIRGIVNEDFVDLTGESQANLEQVAETPSSALGSTRDKPDLKYCQAIFKSLKAHGIGSFFYIGGNDSSDTVRIVSEEAKKENYDLRCMHIPKTIDNDLVINDHTPGFPSAARFVAQAFMGANLDNRSLPGIYMAVIMGRHAGFLTAAAAAARAFPDDGPHLIYVPERVFDEEKFLTRVKQVTDKHGRCVVAISEGIADAKHVPIATKLMTHVAKDAHGNVELAGGALADSLTQLVKDKLGYKRVRGDTFGYVQRSFFGCVSDVDQKEAHAAGEKAVQFAMNGQKDGSVTIHRTGDYKVEYRLSALEDIGGKTKVMPDEFLAPSGDDVTDAFRAYLKPLLGSAMPRPERLTGPKVAKILGLMAAPPISLAEAAQLFERGDLAGAERALAGLSGASEDADALFLLGMIRMRQQNAEEAEALLRRALEIAPAHAQAKLWLGVTVKNDGRGAEAEVLLAEGFAQTKDPGLKAAFVYNLAFAQYNQGRIESALENFARAGELDGGSLNTEIARADLLEELLRFDEAAVMLEQGLARDPSNASMHHAYNDLLHRLGRDSEFLTSYERAPRDPVLETGKAGFLLKTGRLEDAKNVYAGLLKREPGNLEAAIGAAAALGRLGRHDEAIAALEQAAIHHPRNAPLFQNLAAAALQARDPKKAAAMAEKSLILSPVDQMGLAVLGSAWRMMGDARDEMLNGYDELIQAFDLEPPPGFSSMAAFNEELNAWLEKLHPKTREPLQQSLRHGSQTRGHMFGRGHHLVEQLKRRVDEAITGYLAGIRPDARHPFRGRNGQGFRMADSWSSRLTDCGYHINHVHPGGWISSCYYVALPGAVKDEKGKQGWIKFGEPNFDAGLGIRKTIQPVVGRLVLFPSYMWHGTIPFHDSQARTTIAFDAVPNA